MGASILNKKLQQLAPAVVPTKTTDSDGPRCRRFRLDFDKMSRLTRWMASNTPIVIYYLFPTLYVMLEHVFFIKLQ